MNILITGAYGFIGAYVTASLIEAGYSVTCAVREPERAQYKFPSATAIPCDFNKDDEAVWAKRLHNISMVINIVGILESNAQDNITAVHATGTIALFNACVAAGIKRVIHISALGIEGSSSTDYAKTKLLGDHHLEQLPGIDWVILRPSLVYAPGCYGGTSLLRAIATLPFFIPLVGRGEQLFQPVSIYDLIATIKLCLEKPAPIKKIITVVGPTPLSLRETLVSFRQWLGLKPARLLYIPAKLMYGVSAVAGWFSHPTLNITSFKMMAQGSIATPQDLQSFVNFLGRSPQPLTKGLEAMPITIEALWHARLYLLKPMIKGFLGLFWMASGIFPLIFSKDATLAMLTTFGIPEQFLSLVFYGTCALDIALGSLLLLNRKVIWVGVIQIISILGYTTILSFCAPGLWTDPLGAVVKNIPIILLTIIMLSIEKGK